VVLTKTLAANLAELGTLPRKEVAPLDSQASADLPHTTSATLSPPTDRGGRITKRLPRLS
jgi:hypothetical protein